VADRLAASLIQRSGPGLPHGWVTGDDGFGRPSRFRSWLRRHGERYLLDAPSDAVVRDLECGRPERRAGRGARPQVRFGRVDDWAAQQPEERWTRLSIRSGERGPLRVDAMAVRVQTKLERRIGPEERLVVIRTVEAKPRTRYALSNADPAMPLEELVRVRSTRHRIEEVFGAAKGEVGLGRYVVRSWVGWHHHMTLSLRASWFLCGEKRRVGGENASHDGVAGPGGLHAAAPRSNAESGADRRGNQSGIASQGSGTGPPLAHGNRLTSTAPAVTRTS